MNVWQRIQYRRRMGLRRHEVLVSSRLGYGEMTQHHWQRIGPWFSGVAVLV